MATASQSIGEIIATQPSATNVLRRFEIDLSAHAAQSLTQACADLQLSVDQVLEKLAAVEAYETGATTIDPPTMPLQKLIQHIVRLHHRSVRQDLPRLVALARELAATHREPAFAEIEQIMVELQGEIITHIEREENVLFPYIAYLDQPPGIAPPGSSAHFRKVSQPVLMMMNDHDSALQILRRLDRLTNGFRAPADAASAQVLFCTGLHSFEQNLQHHIHLEDDFLFPRAIELEDQILPRK
jgi:regulator of cell morphogenesis and NO signaling